MIHFNYGIKSVNTLVSPTVLQMDEKEPETSQPEYDITDASVNAVTAGINMLTVNNHISWSENTRILRKRVPKVISNENLNRRCSQRPKKRTGLDLKEDDIIKHYLNKKVVRKHNCLETIYEEKDDLNDSTIHMSKRRYKRAILIQNTPISIRKQRKSNATMKKVYISKSNLRRGYATIQMLHDKLNNMRVEPPAKVDSEVQ